MQTLQLDLIIFFSVYLLSFAILIIFYIKKIKENKKLKHEIETLKIRYTTLVNRSKNLERRINTIILELENIEIINIIYKKVKRFLEQKLKKIISND